MKQKTRLAIYGVVGVALLIAMIAAPSVWATPGQSNYAQTVPTRTPQPPAATDTPPEKTAVPGPTSAPQPGSRTVPAVAAAVPPVSAYVGLPPAELPVTGGSSQP